MLVEGVEVELFPHLYNVTCCRKMFVIYRSCNQVYHVTKQFGRTIERITSAAPHAVLGITFRVEYVPFLYC